MIMTVGDRWFRLLVVGRSLRGVDYTGVENVVLERQRSSVARSITACGGSYEVGFGSTTSLTEVFPIAFYQALFLLLGFESWS